MRVPTKTVFIKALQDTPKSTNSARYYFTVSPSAHKHFICPLSKPTSTIQPEVTTHEIHVERREKILVAALSLSTVPTKWKILSKRVQCSEEIYQWASDKKTKEKRYFERRIRMPPQVCNNSYHLVRLTTKACAITSPFVKPDNKVQVSR